jgi:hypothetical protein
MNRLLAVGAAMAIGSGLAMMLAGVLPWAARWHIEADAAAPAALLALFVTMSLVGMRRRRPRNIR